MIDRDDPRVDPEPPIEGLEALHRAQAPRRDLWPEIAAQLDAELARPAARPRWPRRLAWAAAAALLLGVGVRPWLGEGPPAPAPTAPVASAPPSRLEAALAAYREASATLERELRRSTRLNPPPEGSPHAEALGAVLEGLDAVNAALDDLEAAGDAALTPLLVATLEHKVALLNRALILTSRPS